MQTCSHLLMLEKCCQTHIFLQHFVLIQPRTSPPQSFQNLLISPILLTLTLSGGRLAPKPQPRGQLRRGAGVRRRRRLALRNRGGFRPRRGRVALGDGGGPRGGLGEHRDEPRVCKIGAILATFFKSPTAEREERRKTNIYFEKKDLKQPRTGPGKEF